MERKLYRSRTDKKLGGVLGGVAQYIHVDPGALRVLFAALAIFTGGFPCALLYLLCCWILPLEP